MMHTHDSPVECSAEIAASIANRETTIKHAVTCPKQRAPQIGGGGCSRRFELPELTAVLDQEHHAILSQSYAYDLVAYAPEQYIQQLMNQNPNTLACKLPLNIIVPKLDVLELKDVC
jgi:hypothetical protein